MGNNLIHSTESMNIERNISSPSMIRTQGKELLNNCDFSGYIKFLHKIADCDNDMEIKLANKNLL
jgi:hypothetical protein